MNEKAYTAWFPNCTPLTLITRSMSEMKEFLAENGRIVVKPLDGMGGKSIFVVQQGEKCVSLQSPPLKKPFADGDDIPRLHNERRTAAILRHLLGIDRFDLAAPADLALDGDLPRVGQAGVTAGETDRL